ncbi:MAG: hypothetical protein ACPGJV_02895 [Bacteriovoracaceae bacterium]
MKRLILTLLTIGLVTTTLVSCGKNTKDQQVQEMSVANSYLNAKEYEKAIEILESAIEKYLERKEIKIKLAHAYAGAGGFEAIKFGRLIKELEKTKLQGKVGELLAKIENALSKVPQLSNRQKTRLDQAITLYTDLGFDPYSTSGENNFKWGVLHTYRLLVTVKESVTFIREIVEDRTRYTEDEIQKFFIVKGDLFAKDFYKSYQLFKNSFDKLKAVTSKVENLIKNTVESDEFELKIESKAKNYRQFVKDIIRDNKEIISTAIAKVSDKVDLLNLEDSIKRTSILIEGEVDAKKSVNTIVKGFKDNKKDVDARLERLEILARLFLDNVVLKYPQESEKLKRIFDEDLRNEAESAIDLAMQEKHFSPIKDFLESKESNIETIVDAWKILSSEYENSQIQKIAEPDVKALLSYIDKEEAKRLKERAEKATKEIEEITEDGLEDIQKKVNSTASDEKLNDMLRKDAEELEADVKPYTDEVEEAFEIEDKEMEEKAPEIIDNVREYIEQE